MPSLFIKAVKDICTINTFELLNILFSEVNCLHFGFTTRLLDTTNDLSKYELWKLFHRWPLVFGSFFLSPLVARDVVTPDSVGFANGGQNEADGGEEVMFGHDFKSVYGVPVDGIVPKFQRRK